MKNKILLSLFLAILILGNGPSIAVAQMMYTYTFDCITNNSTQDCKIGEKQLRLQVMDIYQGVQFTFINLDEFGGKDSSITDIYFDDPTINAGSPLMNYSTVFIQPPTPDVSFSAPATPPDLPGGGSFSQNYSADSDTPRQLMGVNPGESVYFRIKFINTLNNIEALNTAIASSSLSIGLHVQGFGSGGSESYIIRANPSEGPVPVPEPATMILLGTGLVGVAGAAKRRRKKM